MAEVKGKKIYFLEICFNDSTDEIEYISECIDGSRKTVYYGDIDLLDYFDEEGVALMDEIYEVGVSYINKLFFLAASERSRYENV